MSATPQPKPVPKMSTNERQQFAAKLTAATGGVLVIELDEQTYTTLDDGSIEQGSKGLQFHIEPRDWLEGPIAFDPETWVDGRDHEGDLAAAVVAKVREIATLHVKFAERISRAIENR